jgi:hypothetical protein
LARDGKEWKRAVLKAKVYEVPWYCRRRRNNEHIK